MNTENITALPADETPGRFSWRRIRQFANLYRRNLRLYALIILVCVPVFYVCHTFLPLWVQGVSAMLMALLTMAAPLVFASRDNTLVRLAPVTAAERLTFYMLTALVIAPLLIQLYFLACQFIGSIFTDASVSAYYLKAVNELRSLGISYGRYALFFLGSLSISLLVWNTTLYGALFGRNPVKTAILYGAGTYIGVIFLLGFYGGVLGFIAAKEAVENGDQTHIETDAIASDIINSLGWMMGFTGIIVLCLFVLLTMKIYRRLK